MHRIIYSVITPLLAGLLLLQSGCSDSGAGAKTTVTIKPSSDATSNETGDGDTNSQAGGTPSAAEGFGTFKGKVVFGGAVPSLAVLIRKGQPMKDSDVCAAVDLPDERLVVGSDGGVANVFVYLAKSPKGAVNIEPPTKPVVFDQEGCRFKPHALFVQVGQPLLILSNDQVSHNTNIKTKRGNSFNQQVQPGDRKGVEMIFSTYESAPIPVSCEFHSKMSAWHLALEHPFAAVTDEKGEFEIPNLPAGTHKFKVWHEGVKGSHYLERSLAVTIQADGTTEQVINYPLSKFQP